ncbi:YfiR family protein [Pseudoalteromonas distincta]|uniref:YfiR family protein n=1 Tax=Pseudoalteromonas distincta TaxID=77608 RepID=UPI0032E2C93B
MIKLRNLAHSIFIALLLFSNNANAVEKEYMLKAGFLYNFARFGHWELNQESQKFIICSPDKGFINIANKSLRNKTIKNLPLQSKFITLDDLSECNILFITSDTIELWKQQSNQINGIMVVGETDSFIKSGGHIRFFLSSGKIRFEISPQQLKNAGITMSSKVLRLARIIER